jgi:serine/threonine protein kinase
MAQNDDRDLDPTTPPFDRFTSIRRLSPARSGHHSDTHARHRLYVGRDRERRVDLLIKLTAKPGLVYQHDLRNEIASLSRINEALPHSPVFPFIDDHGQLRDGRVFLIATLFDEFPLATAIGGERVPGRLVGHLRTAMAIARALSDLHQLQIFHVDLNPMNILYRAAADRPVIRIVDFESSYDATRHAGHFYSPPTTAGYCAPEVSQQPPDARADLFSLGAVLYTMVAGQDWMWAADFGACIRADRDLDSDLRDVLLTATAPNPDQRYPTVETFRTALAAYLERIWPGREW